MKSKLTKEQIERNNKLNSIARWKLATLYGDCDFVEWTSNWYKDEDYDWCRDVWLFDWERGVDIERTIIIPEDELNYCGGKKDEE